MSFESLYLYNVTLQPPSSALNAVVGQFQGKKSQEIVIAKHSSIELWKASSSTGKMTKLFSQETFGSIRAISAFRLAGLTTDYLAMTSDSGKFTILQLNTERKKFQVVFNEPFAKTGMRRLLPGQYLSFDAMGRSVMLSAIEKNKIVYVLNRDSDNNLTISSPLEANRNRVLTFASCGLDVGYENPLFASIEIDYGEYELEKIEPDTIPKKTLTFYELDLGLNHVVKKSSESISETANFLLSIPGGNEGPSGVLVGSEDFIQYKAEGQKTHILPIPKRVDQVKHNYKKNYIITGVVHKMKGSFFILLQSSFGDIFKVTVNYTEDMIVKSMNIKYFDTIPICHNLIILKSGFLFANTQSGNKFFYQFVKLGDEDEEQVYNSKDYFNTTEEIDDVLFRPKELDNLQLVDMIESLNPIIDSQLVDYSNGSSSSSGGSGSDEIVAEANEERRVAAICGTGAQSSLRLLQHGLTVNEVVTSELPAIATGVWTSKLTLNDKYDKYLVISFPDSTLVLSIGESVEEVTDSQFETERATVGVQQMGLNSLMQVHTDGVIHLSIDDEGNTTKVNEWFPPAGIKITTMTSTNYQLALGLSNRELVYFELDDEEKLIEYQERKEMPGQILSLSLGDIPEGKLRSNFLAISCNNQTLRIVSVDPNSTLELVTVQSLSSNATSVLMLLMPELSSSSSSFSMANELRANLQLYLHIGLENGIYVKTLINSTTGQITDKIVQYLGPYPIELSKIIAGSGDQAAAVAAASASGTSSSSHDISSAALVCAGTRTHVGFVSSNNGGFKVLPLAYESRFNHGTSFNSEDCPNGLVGVHENNLMILTLEDVSNEFKVDTIPLKYTPKRLAIFKNEDKFVYYVAQSDQNTVPLSAGIKEETESKQDEENEEPQRDQIGYVRETGSWASCVQCIDAHSGELLQELPFGSNENLFNISTVYFKTRNATFVVVSSGENFTFGKPPSLRQQQADKPKFYLTCYEVNTNTNTTIDEDDENENGQHLQLSFVHRTEVEKPVASMCPFAGRLLVGLGNTLRLYDIGQKQLLRKAEHTFAQLHNIVKISSQGWRCFIGDIRESVTFAVYRARENIFIPFADDVVARHVTSFTTLDYDTVVGGDKFGNLWVVRCPEEASQVADEGTEGADEANDKANGLFFILKSQQDSFLGGSAYRLNLLCHYYVDDIVTSLHKRQDNSGLNELVIYTGLQGTIGILSPLVSKNQVNFFQLLEKEMLLIGGAATAPVDTTVDISGRGSSNGKKGDDEMLLVGRDHLMYRSYYAPQKAVIDGDLCEKFLTLNESRKNKIALKLGKSVKDIEKRILDIRLRITI